MSDHARLEALLVSLDQRAAPISELVNELRPVLDALDPKSNDKSFDLRAIMSGRLSGGDMSVHYQIGDYGEAIKGNSIRAVVIEWLRRRGYSKRHEPVLLSYTDAATAKPLDEEGSPF